MRTRVQIILLSIFLTTLASSKIIFHEEFNKDWESRWVKSQFKGDEQGRFEWTKGKWPLENDMAYGIKTSGDLKFFDISSRLPTPITTGKNPLVLQYSLKFEKDVECGGGYIKLVGKDYKPEEFGGDTPVDIMFGPDICGSENRIQLMLDFDGKGKLWNKSPAAPIDHITHVYTLLLNPNETYEVYVDMELVGNGTIADDWDVSTPKMIPDPNDKKPDDWDDRMYLDDPKSVKPDDWVDEEMIEDKTATKPEDWDDAKEGEWKPPMIVNPAYKGEWKPAKVYNINYKGIWRPKKIPNPDFKEGLLMKPYTISGVGIDVWQVRDGTVFDNIMIADSLEDAFAEAKKIMEIQVAEEKKFEEQEKKEEEARAEAEAQKSEDVEDDEKTEYSEKEDL